MKPHLISAEILARQVYRYNPAYRFAAFVLFSFLFLQVPLIVWLIYERQVGEEKRARAAQLAIDAARIATARRALADTERKLKRIEDLTPLLRARMPISAVLGKIEQLTPQEVDLSRITIDSGNFQPVQVEKSLFQIPGEIRIVIEGEQIAAGECKSLAEKLLQSLPPGSKISETNLVEGSKTFRLTLSAPANGNYFGLGVTKIAAENSL
jgi:hypothetical protein